MPDDNIQRRLRNSLRRIEDAEADVRLARRLLVAAVAPFVLMLSLWLLPITGVVASTEGIAGCAIGGIPFLIMGGAATLAWLNRYFGEDADDNPWQVLRDALRHHEDLLMEEF